MIFTFIAYLGGVIINLIAALFSALSFAIPQQMTDSIFYFVSKLKVFGFFFPINTLMQAAGVFLNFLMLFYMVKILLWIIGHIPWINTQPLPEIGGNNVLDLRNTAGSLDLRDKRNWGKGRQTMRDIK